MGTKTWKRNPNVVARRIGGDTILVPTGRDIVEQRRLFTLNDTGSFVWETLVRPSTPDQIHRALMAEFEVEDDQALADLNRFIERLAAAGCIVEE